MTDNEIIKALECCINADCLNCPNWTEEFYSIMCNDFLRIVLDLINRLKAENEEIRKDIVTAEEYAWKLKAKNEALQMDNEQLKSDIINERMNLEHIQAENEALISAQETLQKQFESKNSVIERLRHANKCAIEALSGEYGILLERKNAEIERLERENHCFADIGKMYSEVKAEAIKEFAERLKGLLSLNVRVSNEDYLDISIDIDNLVKEMEGDMGV